LLWRLGAGYRRWTLAQVALGPHLLAFGGILVAFGALLPAVMMLPLGGAAEWTWKFILLKVVGLALLLLVLYGGLRWWIPMVARDRVSFPSDHRE